MILIGQSRGKPAGLVKVAVLRKMGKSNVCLIPHNFLRLKISYSTVQTSCAVIGFYILHPRSQTFMDLFELVYSTGHTHMVNLLLFPFDFIVSLFVAWPACSVSFTKVKKHKVRSQGQTLHFLKLKYCSRSRKNYFNFFFISFGQNYKNEGWKCLL